MDEKRLIELAKLNNQNALSKLLDQNYNFVYGYILKLCFDKSLAEDITQDTMVKAILNIKKFKGQSKFSTWLIQIAHNHYLNIVKRNKKVTYHSNDVLDVFQNEIKSIEESYESKDKFIRVMTLLKKYKDKHRIPFILKHYYDYSYEEIATIMSCPIGTVRSRIHNTIKKLQVDLKGENDEM